MNITDELKNRLNATMFAGPYYHCAYRDSDHECPVEFVQDGITMVGLNHNIHYLSRYERPAHIGELMSQLSVILMASPKYREKNGDHATLSQVLDDAARTSSLRRLKQEQKDYIIDWIYSSCEAFGRNKHEVACLTLNILGGGNYVQLHSPEPFTPKLGAIGKTMDIMCHAIEQFQELGAYKNQNPDMMAMQIMIEAGVDKKKLENATYVRILQKQLILDTMVTYANEWLHSVSEALYAVDHEADKHTWDMNELAQQCKPAGYSSRSMSPFGSCMRVVTYAINGIAHLYPVLNNDPAPLEAMIPTLMVDISNHIKRWNKRYGA